MSIISCKHCMESKTEYCNNQHHDNVHKKESGLSTNKIPSWYLKIQVIDISTEITTVLLILLRLLASKHEYVMPKHDLIAMGIKCGMIGHETDHNRNFRMSVSKWI